jgi:cation transport ATPase
LGLAALASLRGDGMAKSIEAFFIGVLIFCPCLFASIIPLSKQMASVTLLKIGVLLQRPEALYPLGQLQTIYLDKTGTLAAVESEFIPADPQLPAGEKSDLLGLLQELSVKTQHPILRNFSFQKQELANRLEEITEFPGFGVKAIIRDHDGSSQTLWLGRPDFVVAQTGIYLPQRDSIFPVLVLDQKVVGQLIGKAIFDEQAMKFIDQVLRFRSDLKIEILSGDPNPQAGQSWVAIQPERISYYGQLSPEQKAQRIGPNSLFVGDGLNDTLALAKATVSCRLGQRVLGFAPVDIQLQAPNLENILVVLRYAKKYKSIQWQTAMLAFSYNLIALTLAALGKFSPLGAVLAMLTSFLLLLLSSLRLLKIPRS